MYIVKLHLVCGDSFHVCKIVVATVCVCVCGVHIHRTIVNQMQQISESKRHDIKFNWLVLWGTLNRFVNLLLALAHSLSKHCIYLGGFFFEAIADENLIISSPRFKITATRKLCVQPYSTASTPSTRNVIKFLALHSYEIKICIVLHECVCVSEAGFINCVWLNGICKQRVKCK